MIFSATIRDPWRIISRKVNRCVFTAPQLRSRISLNSINFSKLFQIIFDRWLSFPKLLQEFETMVRGTRLGRLAKPSKEIRLLVDLDSFELFIETRETENSVVADRWIIYSYNWRRIWPTERGRHRNLVSLSYRRKCITGFGTNVRDPLNDVLIIILARWERAFRSSFLFLFPFTGIVSRIFLAFFIFLSVISY